MNINNLKEHIKTTNVIPNYRRLCEILEVNVLTGNAKISQLKELERYFKFHKEGNKFVFDEAYEEVKEKIDNRKGNSGKSEGSRNNNTAEYIKNIEKLILNLLIQGSRGKIGFGKVLLSKNSLLKELNMINENYPYCKERILKLSKLMNISKENVEEWFSSTGDMLERNLECALKSLEKQSLILWSKEITVARAIPLAEITEEGKKIIVTKTKDEYDEEIINYEFKADSRVTISHREGTEDEKTFILKTEREILKELNCLSKQTIIQMGMWETFKDKVNEIVLKELDIAFYYKSYKILFNEEHVLEAGEDMCDSFILPKNEQEKHEETLNKSFVDRNMKNAIKKHEKAVEEKSTIWGNLKDSSDHRKIERRSKGEYLIDNHTLNSTLIVPNAKDIKDKVKKTKVIKFDADSQKMMDELFSKQ